MPSQRLRDAIPKQTVKNPERTKLKTDFLDNMTDLYKEQQYGEVVSKDGDYHRKLIRNHR